VPELVLISFPNVRLNSNKISGQPIGWPLIFQSPPLELSRSP
jgi:hypothetical protein